MSCNVHDPHILLKKIWKFREPHPSLRKTPNILLQCTQWDWLVLSTINNIKEIRTNLQYVPNSLKNLKILSWSPSYPYWSYWCSSQVQNDFPLSTVSTVIPLIPLILPNLLCCMSIISIISQLWLPSNRTVAKVSWFTLKSLWGPGRQSDNMIIESKWTTPITSMILYLLLYHIISIVFLRSLAFPVLPTNPKKTNLSYWLYPSYLDYLGCGCWKHTSKSPNTCPAIIIIITVVTRPLLSALGWSGYTFFWWYTDYRYFTMSYSHRVQKCSHTFYKKSKNHKNHKNSLPVQKIQKPQDAPPSYSLSDNLCLSSRHSDTLTDALLIAHNQIPKFQSALKRQLFPSCHNTLVLDMLSA